ncbi:MAG: SDR family NAD(P)-dependent oxidoreductase, partial [Deltaproteobacteria bacterium]|nr:SDR family NAD(P)-dependent oxidoreductase [Deltaproteobacteria bacterium]
FVPILLEQDEGHVINTASIAGLIPGLGIYGVTKHACVALSESLWSGFQNQGANVGVSVLCPGWVATRIAESERNRPEAPRVSSAVGPEVEAMRKLLEGVIASGMDPTEVGRIVASAIKEQRFYVLTHHWENMVEARMRNILEGRNPVGEAPPDSQEWFDTASEKTD